MRFRSLSCATGDVLQVTPGEGCRCTDCRCSRFAHAVQERMGVARHRGRSMYVALTVDLGTAALPLAYDAVATAMMRFGDFVREGV